MTADPQRTIALLERSASGLAGLAAERLSHRSSKDPQSGALQAFQLWKSNLELRLRELATALREGSTDLFRHQVEWSADLWHARQEDEADLGISLSCLAEVLEEELGPEQFLLMKPYLTEAQQALSNRVRVQEESLTLDTPCGRLAAEYLKDLLEGRRRDASRRILGAVTEGNVSLKDAYLKVVLAAQVEAGQMWVRNEISIAEEHFITSSARMVLAQLLSLAPLEPSRDWTVVTAAVHGNAHDLGIHAVADFFEMDGWRVIQLGANTPHEDLVQAAQAFGADLAAVSASLCVQRPVLAEAIRGLRQAERPVPVLFGGTTFATSPPPRGLFGAQAFAPTVQDAIRLGGELVNAARQ